MQKEMIVILLLLGLPAIFILTTTGGITGQLANEAAVLREERINLYLNFPETEGIYQVPTYRVKNGLRMSASHRYFTPQGLKDGQYYFNREQEIINELLQLTCLEQADKESRYVSTGGISVGEFESQGQIPCNEQLAVTAERTIGHILTQDFRLVYLTAQHSHCPEAAMNTLEYAIDNIEQGHVDNALNNLRSAWRQATTCA